MSAQNPMQGSTWTTVFTVEGEISRSPSSHVMRIVHKGLLQEPSHAEGSASQMEPKRTHYAEVPKKGGDEFDGHGCVPLYEHPS